jgi:hypothetical protein
MASGAWLPPLFLVGGALRGVVLDCHVSGLLGLLHFRGEFIRLGQAPLDRHIWLGCGHGASVPPIARTGLLVRRRQATRDLPPSASPVVGIGGCRSCRKSVIPG